MGGTKEDVVDALGEIPWLDLDGQSLAEGLVWEGVPLWDFLAEDYHWFAQGFAGGKAPAPSTPLPASLTRAAAGVLAPLVGRVGRRLAGAQAPAAPLLVTVHHKRLNHLRAGRADPFWTPLLAGLPGHLRSRIATVAPWTGTSFPFPGDRGAYKGMRRRTSWDWPPHLAFESLRSRCCFAAQQAASRRFRPLLRRLLRSGVFAPVANLDPEAARAARAWYRHRLLVTAPRVVEQMCMAHHAMTIWRPVALLATNEYGRWERALVTAARQNAVPVLAMQHGVIHRRHPGYVLPPEHASLQGVPHEHVTRPSSMGVFGNNDCRLLADQGWPQDRVCVIGHPAQTDIAAWRARGKQEARSSLRLSQNATIVLWATQTHGFPLQETIAARDALVDACRMLKMELHIRLHPGENPAAPLYRGLHVHGAGVQLASLLVASDVVVTRSSTVGVEALAAGRPLVIVNLSGGPDPVDYVAQEAARGAYAIREVEPALRQAMLEGPRPRAAQYVVDHMGPEGPPAPRFAKWVEDWTSRDARTSCAASGSGARSRRT